MHYALKLEVAEGLHRRVCACGKGGRASRKCTIRYNVDRKQLGDVEHRISWKVTATFVGQYR